MVDAHSSRRVGKALRQGVTEEMEPQIVGQRRETPYSDQRVLETTVRELAAPYRWLAHLGSAARSLSQEHVAGSKPIDLGLVWREVHGEDIGQTKAPPGDIGGSEIRPHVWPLVVFGGALPSKANLSHLVQARASPARRQSLVLVLAHATNT